MGRVIFLGAEMRYDKLMKNYKEYLDLVNYSQRTVESYTEGLKTFIEYIEKEKGIRRPQDIKKEHIREYQTKVHALKRKQDNKALSSSRKEQLLVSVKSFFKYLIKTGQIIYNPASDMDIPSRRKRNVREVLTEREMRKLLRKIKGRTPQLEIRDRALIELLYSTGIRNMEIRNLKPSDIDFEREEIIIREGKGGKWRVLPSGSIALGYIEEYLIQGRPKLLKNEKTPELFINCRGGKLSRRSISEIVRRYAYKAGIKKRATAHTLRHSCATHLLRGGADLRYVQELLGHASLDTTQIYTRVEISDLKKVHSRTHPREIL